MAPTREPFPERLWRAFPWDPGAAEGASFSASFVPPTQGQGRFDLPGTPGGVLYLAETPEHAMAERIQYYRGQVLEPPDLRLGGRGLALVGVTLSQRIRNGVIDLCDPAVLVRLGLRPDETASHHRKVTQRIASEIHRRRYRGLRWWSALTGEWHTVVLFRDRLRPPPMYSAPEPIALAHRAVVEAARVLGIRRGR